MGPSLLGKIIQATRPSLCSVQGPLARCKSLFPFKGWYLSRDKVDKVKFLSFSLSLICGFCPIPISPRSTFSTFLDFLFIKISYTVSCKHQVTPSPPRSPL